MPRNYHHQRLPIFTSEAPNQRRRCCFVFIPINECAAERLCLFKINELSARRVVDEMFSNLIIPRKTLCDVFYVCVRVCVGCAFVFYGIASCALGRIIFELLPPPPAGRKDNKRPYQ